MTELQETKNNKLWAEFVNLDALYLLALTTTENSEVEATIKKLEN